jgi:predicted  nucleic acid-binding Zn-ribbon protein
MSDLLKEGRLAAKRHTQCDNTATASLLLDLVSSIELMEKELMNLRRAYAQADERIEELEEKVRAQQKDVVRYVELIAEMQQRG